MQRLRLYDCRTSRLPNVIGLCQKDIADVAAAVNTSQRRLIYAKETSEEGWNGSWAEMVFTIDPANPYITTPRDVARIQDINICDRTVPIQNQFYEYLRFGNGRLPKRIRQCPGNMQVYSRNNVPTFVDLNPGPQILRCYISDAADIASRVLFQGLDNNGINIVSQDGYFQIQGIYVPLDSPFADCPIQMTSITGIQKDVTVGPVQIFQVDPTTGVQTLILTMQPAEQTAWYRRYLLNPAPSGCCFPTGTGTLQATAIVKLDLIPVVADQDYCLIQNLEALIEECQSARYSEMDKPESKVMAAQHHTNAIRLLNGELTHLFSKEQPAINVAPFGSARLECARVGTLI